MILSIFPDRGTAKEEGHHQENEAHDLKPELVQHAAGGAGRGAHGTGGGFDGAAAAYLIACHPHRDTCFSPTGNFAHGLDFNSLRRYNEPTQVGGEPNLPPAASDRLAIFPGEAQWTHNLSN